MTDSNLRELERRFRASGSVEDEAAWLRERVRVGELPQERLELAACLVHGIAVLVLAEEAPIPWGLAAEALSFEGFDAPQATRIGIAATLSVEGLPPSQARSLTRNVVQAVEDWVISPSAEHASRCSEAGWEAGWEAHWVGTPPGQVPYPSEDTTPERNLAVAAINLGWLPASREGYEGSLEVILGAAILARGSVEVCSDSKQDRKGVWVAVRDELVPWALGDRDRVRERVEARQREAAE